MLRYNLKKSLPAEVKHNYIVLYLNLINPQNYQQKIYLPV